MKKILLITFASIMLMMQTPLAQAQVGVLPAANNEEFYCIEDGSDQWRDSSIMMRTKMDPNTGEEISASPALLGCAIKTALFKFWMVPYLITYILTFIISLASLISILMIMVGAYFYIAGGLNEDKEKGKNTIKYAIMGLVLTVLSWSIINLLLLAFTA
jgi:hypothetical protein